MTAEELETIERRAFEGAMFATKFPEKLALECRQKIYDIYFSQNAKNETIARKTGIDTDTLFNDITHNYIPLVKSVVLEDPLNVYAITLDGRENNFLRSYLIYGRHLIKTGKIKSVLLDPKETKSYKKLCSVILGQDEMKKMLCRLGDVFQYSKRREIYDLAPFPMHKVFAFVGPPGTAKTTAAVFFASMMKEMEVLEGSRMAYVTGTQLKAKYVGQTSERVHDLFAKNDIIIIDEAYSLVNYNEAQKTDNFSQEALAQLCTEVEEHSNDKLVIFAGYGGDIAEKNNKMKQFLTENPGIASRITFTVNFGAYDVEEMLSIFELQAYNADFKIESGWRELLTPFFAERIKSDNFGNGREARRLLELSMTAAAEDYMSFANMEIDLFSPQDENEKEFLSTIKLSHLKTAISAFLKAEAAVNGNL